MRIVLGIAASLNFGSSSAAGAQPRASEGSVRLAADEFAAAVRAGDADALLRLIAIDGVRCPDGIVPRQELRKQLRLPGTWLGAYFFAPEIFKERFADAITPMSFAEFVATARDLRVTASSKQDPRRTCVRFVASNLKWTPAFCFRWARTRWVVADLHNCS